MLTRFAFRLAAPTWRTHLKPGQPHYGVNRPGAYDPDQRGYLRAVDPLTGKSKWSIPFKSPNISVARW
jgi:hypothetical protein